MNDYTNYHNINTNEKITHDGLLLLEKSLSGFSGYDVIINNTISSRVLLYQKWDSNGKTKKVIGLTSDIEIGNILDIDNYKWLITTLPEDNKIYRKAELEICNETFIYKIEGTKTIVGYDDFGRPIEETSAPTIYNIPCVLADKTTTTEDNSPLLLPEGTIEIKLPYKTGQIPPLNYTFEYRDNPYKVKTISYENVINNVGYIVIRLERVVGGVS